MTAVGEKKRNTAMRLNLKTTDVAVSEETRSYLQKKLQGLRKFFDAEDDAVMIDVELGRTTRHHGKGDIFFAEINIHRGRESFRAVSDRPDLMSAIDAMRDAIARELVSKKGKAGSIARRGGQIAKAILKGGYGGLQYLGSPARAGWKYVKSMRWWRRG